MTSLATVFAGDVFGRLTVVRELEDRDKHQNRIYECRCSCGMTLPVKGMYLRAGKTRSCGCLSRELSSQRGSKINRSHGHTWPKRSPTYQSWSAMHDRCRREGHIAWEHYGGRGIAIEDPRWYSFECFLEDMGERPEGRTLDRIDNDRGYCRANCRWATAKEQANNQRPRMKRVAPPPEEV